MKILHLPASYLPYYTGGKEVFVAHLAEELQRLGHENLVVVHADDRIPPIGTYNYRGIRVEVMPSIKVTHSQYWSNTCTLDDSFERLLKKEHPDIVHFHDQSGGASLNHLKIVKKLGIKTLLTYHSPGQSCPQRALLYRGRTLCDGKLLIDRCSKCLYINKEIPNFIASLLIKFPIKFKNIESSSIKRFLNLTHSVDIFKESFEKIYELHDGIHIYCYWIKEVLKSNNVGEEKIYFVPQTIPMHDKYDEDENNDTFSEDKLKLAFFGRCTYIKGVHILVKAIKLLPSDFPVEVNFYGPYWDNTNYGKKLLNAIEKDVRFKKPKLLPPAKVLSVMGKMDAVLVPSLWPETGPFVVLEAFRAGVPVIGTRAAGIAEKVEHLKNGLLFEWGNAKELAQCIQILYERKINNQPFTIPTLPTITEMALMMLEVYKKL